MRDLKEAGAQTRHLSASEPLVGGQGRARCRGPPKPDTLLVPPGGREGRWARTEATILPGEGPLTLGRCNGDTLSLKRRGDVCVMEQGPAEDAVVIVKPGAGEVMVTSLRSPVSHRKAGSRRPAREQEPGIARCRRDHDYRARIASERRAKPAERGTRKLDLPVVFQPC